MTRGVEESTVRRMDTLVDACGVTGDGLRNGEEVIGLCGRAASGSRGNSAGASRAIASGYSDTETRDLVTVGGMAQSGSQFGGERNHSSLREVAEFIGGSSIATNRTASRVDDCGNIGARNESRYRRWRPIVENYQQLGTR